MLTEYDCGLLEAATDGDYDFKFTVPGKNATSSGHALVLDYIKLTSVESESAPALHATHDGSQLVLSWPTNYSGYSLVAATDFSPSTWLPVLPASIVIGEVNVVTNQITGDRAFNRLEKPSE